MSNSTERSLLPSPTALKLGIRVPLAMEQKQDIKMKDQINALAEQLAKANARAREAAVFVASTEQEIDDLESQIATLTEQLAKANARSEEWKEQTIDVAKRYEAAESRAAQMFERIRDTVKVAQLQYCTGASAIHIIELFRALQLELEQGEEKGK